MIKKIGILLFFILIFTGCSSTINSVKITRQQNQPTGFKWQVDNPFLADDIHVLEVKEIKKGSLLYVAVKLQNTWYNPISAKLKVEFYDKDGVALDNPWGWHPIILEAHQASWFKFMAPKQAKEISAVKIMIRGIGNVQTPE